MEEVCMFDRNICYLYFVCSKAKHPNHELTLQYSQENYTNFYSQVEARNPISNQIPI
jgi:hypothetical protein